MRRKTPSCNPIYKVAITIKLNAIANTYTMIFNGTDKSITLPKLGKLLVYEHAAMVLHSFGIKVSNYIYSEKGEYMLIVPMLYWNKVRELFHKTAR